MTSEYLQRILRARVYAVARETPLEPAPLLSNRLGVKVWFKREDLQPLFSFKLRGAYNKLAQLEPARLEGGVICASAGNHAQGVALAASERGVPALVVMPEQTPSIKVDAVRALGAEVLLEGNSFDDACGVALRLADERGLAFIHPFDDPDVIAGQGTIGMEIIRQAGDALDAVIVPIGGGGLIAGIAAYIKSVSPHVRVIGVEPHDAASMTAAYAAGAPVTLSEVGGFAEGVAVRRVGDETYRVCREHVSDIALVSNDEICAAVQDIFEDSRAIVEPAGALAVAGLKKLAAAGEFAGQNVVTVNCGANVNFSRLRHIAERAAIGEQREALFAVEIPEEKGSFLRFCQAIGKRNVTEFNYRFQAPGKAHVFVGLELTQGLSERAAISAMLESNGYRVIDLSDDELSKAHLRHMVGGAAPTIADEQLYRFEFPERPGALLEFLRAVGQRWNISLFHYRNHGADYGRVLAGVQVPANERAEFDRHLQDLGYPWHEESTNPVYRMFLGPA